MKDEFSDRHQAIKLRLAGHSVEYICQTLGRSREWFHTWWRRYQARGRRRTLRPDACPSPAPAHRAGLGVLYPQHPTTTRIATASSDTLQSHRGQHDSGRTQGLACAAIAMRAHPRTCLGTQRGDDTSRALGALPADACLPHTPSAALQPTSSDRPGRADLSQGPAAALLHLCWYSHS